ELRSFFAYNSAFSGGVRVASGDVNLDGFTEIITGAGPGGGPHVKVFSDLVLVQSFLAYNPTFSGGVFVAGGDVSGDGVPDIITGAGAGGGPNVRVFSGINAAQLQDFLVFGAGFSGGISVATADVNADGRLDIIAAAGPGGGTRVKVFDGISLGVLDSFF